VFKISLYSATLITAFSFGFIELRLEPPLTDGAPGTSVDQRPHRESPHHAECAKAGILMRRITGIQTDRSPL
jgi:hypothetical protein